jgi:hypothetical protein
VIVNNTCPAAYTGSNPGIAYGFEPEPNSGSKECPNAAPTVISAVARTPIHTSARRPPDRSRPEGKSVRTIDVVPMPTIEPHLVSHSTGNAPGHAE